MIKEIAKTLDNLNIKYREIILGECYYKGITPSGSEIKILYIPFRLINEPKGARPFIPLDKLDQFREQMTQQGYWIQPDDGEEFLNGECYKFLIMKKKE